MSAILQFSLSTIDHVLVSSDDVLRIEAEDASGHFTLAPGHTDFVAALVPSIVKWTGRSGVTQYAAVGDAALYLERGRVQVFAREAALGDNPAVLLSKIQTARRLRQDEAHKASQSAAALDEAARRQIDALTRARS